MVHCGGGFVGPLIVVTSDVVKLSAVSSQGTNITEIGHYGRVDGRL